MVDEVTPETSEDTPTPEATPTPRRMTAKVGRIDGALQEVGFVEGERVKELIEKAGLTFGKGMEITDDAGEDVGEMSNAVDGAVYWISGNFQNGSY